MKQFLILSLIFCLGSCVTVPKWPYIQESSIIDYSQYTNKGFFITQANSVNFDYLAIGSISSKVESGYEILNTNMVKVLGDDVYSPDQKTKAKIKYGKYIRATPEMALENLYKKAVESGANGIVGLTIEPITNYSPHYGNVTVGYFVAGMAIKKKQ